MVLERAQIFFLNLLVTRNNHLILRSNRYLHRATVFQTFQRNDLLNPIALQLERQFQSDCTVAFAVQLLIFCNEYHSRLLLFSTILADDNPYFNFLLNLKRSQLYRR